VQYTMIAMPIGMLLVVFLSGRSTNASLFEWYLSRPIESMLSRRDSFMRLPLYALSGVALLSVAYTFAAIGSVPLAQVIAGGDALALAITRVDASMGFSGNVYVRNFLGYMLTPILAYVSYGYFRQTGSIRDRLWFCAMLVGAFFILTYDLSKAPIVVFALGFLFFHVLADGGVSRKLFFLFGVLAVLLVLAGYAFIGKVTDPIALFSYNSGIGGRIFLSQAAGTYYAFEHFPASREFIGIASMSGLLSDIFGVESSERSSRIIMTIFNPTGVEEGSAAVMNSLFIAEAWANFGLLGVLVAPVYVGIFVQAVFMFFLKARKTPIVLGMFTYLSLKMPITGGFNDFVYAPGLMAIAFMFVTIYLMAVMLKALSRKMRMARIAAQGA